MAAPKAAALPLGDAPETLLGFMLCNFPPCTFTL
jgi:hypothetical protein